MKPIEPSICKPDPKALVTGPEEICRPCPLGTIFLNGTHCGTCQSGYLSSPDGKTCQPCPKDEVPVFGIKYENWSRMPPRMSTYCHDDSKLIAFIKIRVRIN